MTTKLPATNSTNASTGASRNANNDSASSMFDLVIVGGGVVGCAVLRAATLEGWRCALVESESHLLSHARYVGL